MIRVNDKWNIDSVPGMTVRDVLDACEFTHHHLVVSIDGNLVPPAEYDTQAVLDGAEVRVVHVIGGG
jgi:thiamine biosynthesis protein ThiS